MGSGNTQDTPPSPGEPIAIDTFGPLAAASRGRPTGRVRTLEEARRSLWIPNSADPAVLRLWGMPTDFQLAVYAVRDAEAPDRVAEFALLRVVTRKGRDLVVGDRRTRLRMAEKSNALWVVYGSIATAHDGSLIIESLAIGPAFDGQLSREGDDIALGVTGQLLRLLSPPRILAACAERLVAQGRLLDAAAQRGSRAMPQQQRDLLERVDQGRPRHAKVTDDQLVEFATRYLTLYHRGVPQLRQQLSHEFGLTTTQVRDRTNQARRRGYLTPGRPGRAGAQPGPRLMRDHIPGHRDE
jgi:hypothetical protein